MIFGCQWRRGLANEPREQLAGCFGEVQVACGVQDRCPDNKRAQENLFQKSCDNIFIHEALIDSIKIDTRSQARILSREVAIRFCTFSRHGLDHTGASRQ